MPTGKQATDPTKSSDQCLSFGFRLLEQTGHLWSGQSGGNRYPGYRLSCIRDLQNVLGGVYEDRFQYLSKLAVGNAVTNKNAHERPH